MELKVEKYLFGRLVSAPLVISEATWNGVKHLESLRGLRTRGEIKGTGYVVQTGRKKNDWEVADGPPGTLSYQEVDDIEINEQAEGLVQVARLENIGEFVKLAEELGLVDLGKIEKQMVKTLQSPYFHRRLSGQWGKIRELWKQYGEQVV